MVSSVCGGNQVRSTNTSVSLMVATQNIDTLGPIWWFSLRCVLTFEASGSDVYGCELSYFEGDIKFTLLYKLYKSLHEIWLCFHLYNIYISP